jgi:hypothetical protein
MGALPEMAWAVGLMDVPILVGVALGGLLVVLPFWMICKKAGFAPALALLMLVPVANIILPFYLAFASWPALQQHNSRPVP